MDKPSLRRQMLAARRTLQGETRRRYEQAIRLHFRSRFLPAATLLLYYPVQGEVDLLPLAREALAAGSALFFPAIENKRILFRRVQDIEQDLQPGPYTIPQPGRLCSLREPDAGEAVLAVPGLAFTRRGERLGYGGGYFDRFLADFSGTSVGICFSLQMQEEVAAVAHDRTVLYLCTESGVEECNNKS